MSLADLLRQRFFSGIHLGALKSGDRLPSVRDLELELGVNRRAVLRAYRELESEGIVELRERSGIFFGRRVARLRKLSPPAEWIVDVFVRGLSMGLPAPGFPASLASYLSTVRLRALCVECNFDQLSSLSAEMESDFGFDVAVADVDDLLAEKSARTDLVRADLIVTTQFHAGEVQEIAGRVGRPWIAVSPRTDIYAGIARLLHSTAVYFIVADERYATKLHRIFGAVPGAQAFRALVVDRDDLDSIPESAPTYMSRAAREKLTNKSLLQRVMLDERTFSLASAREILTLVVGVNMTAIEEKSG